MSTSVVNRNATRRTSAENKWCLSPYILELSFAQRPDESKVLNESSKKKKDIFQLFTQYQIATKQSTLAPHRGDCEKLINSKVCQLVTPTQSPLL